MYNIFLSSYRLLYNSEINYTAIIVDTRSAVKVFISASVYIY